MAGATKPKYSGDHPPNLYSDWSSSKSGLSEANVTLDGDFFTGHIIDDHEGDTTNVEPMTRVVYTAEAAANSFNTVDPVIDMAFSLGIGSGAFDFGIVIVGSTGQVSAGYTVPSLGNAPFIQMATHTGTSDRGTFQSPASAGPNMNGGLIWLRMVYDTATSDLTQVWVSNDGTNFIQVAANEFLDIGTIERIGFHFTVDNNTSGRTLGLFRIYHFEVN